MGHVTLCAGGGGAPQAPASLSCDWTARDLATSRRRVLLGKMLVVGARCRRSAIVTCRVTGAGKKMGALQPQDGGRRPERPGAGRGHRPFLSVQSPTRTWTPHCCARAGHPGGLGSVMSSWAPSELKPAPGVLVSVAAACCRLGPSAPRGVQSPVPVSPTSFLKSLPLRGRSVSVFWGPVSKVAQTMRAVGKVRGVTAVGGDAGKCEPAQSAGDGLTAPQMPVPFP